MARTEMTSNRAIPTKLPWKKTAGLGVGLFLKMAVRINKPKTAANRNSRDKVLITTCRLYIQAAKESNA